jgi:hypothetical protein
MKSRRNVGRIKKVTPPALLVACRKKRVQVLTAHPVSVNGETLQLAARLHDAVQELPVFGLARQARGENLRQLAVRVFCHLRIRVATCVEELEKRNGKEQARG